MSEIIEKMKEKVAFEAASKIQSNTKVGLGSGSTVRYLVKQISTILQNKGISNVNFVCSSIETEQLCRKNNLPIKSLDEDGKLDTYIDGADEITNFGIAIKGLGGALTREKISRQSSKEFIAIITSNKLVKSLGQNVPLPIEIIKFGYSKTIDKIKNLNIEGFGIKNIRLRKNKATNEPFITDNSNYIVDIDLTKQLPSQVNLLEQINKSIKAITGVVETGLFISPADIIYVGNIEKMSIEKIVT